MGVVFFPSLPFMGVMLFPSFSLGNVFGGGGASFASHSLFFSLSSSSSFLPLLPSFLFSFLSSSTAFSSASSSFFSSFLLCPHLFFLFSFLPITLLFLSFSFVPFLFFFFFFFGELLVLSAFQDIIEDTASCNRMQFIRNKERLVMSMNFPIACFFYIIELFEVSN